jgi:hypothetical protein
VDGQTHQRLLTRARHHAGEGVAGGIRCLGSRAGAVPSSKTGGSGESRQKDAVACAHVPSRVSWWDQTRPNTFGVDPPIQCSKHKGPTSGSRSKLTVIVTKRILY